MIRLDNIWELDSYSKEILELDRRNFGTACWDKNQWQGLFSQPGARIYLTFSGEVTTGFLAGHSLNPEAELLKICVDQGHQGSPTASRLMERFIHDLSQEGSDRIHLEVHCENTRALAFYRKWDFQITGRRKGYYAHPPGDAILMTKGWLP